MLFAFASCVGNKNESPERLVNDALEKNRNLGAYEADIALAFKIDMQGFSLDIPIDINMKTKNVGKADEASSVECGFSMFGYTQSLNIYMEDGWMYYDDGDSRYKKATEGDGETVDSLCDSFLSYVPSKYFDGKSLVKNKDGSKSASVVMPLEEFGSTMGSVTGELYGELFGAFSGIEGVGNDGGNVEITYTVDKNGYLSSMKTRFYTTVDVGALMGVGSSSEATVEVDVSISYSNFNGDVTPVAPKNYSSFGASGELFNNSDNSGDFIISAAVVPAFR